MILIDIYAKRLNIFCYSRYLISSSSQNSQKLQLRNRLINKRKRGIRTIINENNISTLDELIRFLNESSFMDSSSEEVSMSSEDSLESTESLELTALRRRGKNRRRKSEGSGDDPSTEGETGSERSRRRQRGSRRQSSEEGSGDDPSTEGETGSERSRRRQGGSRRQSSEEGSGDDDSVGDASMESSGGEDAEEIGGRRGNRQRNGRNQRNGNSGERLRFELQALLSSGRTNNLNQQVKLDTDVEDDGKTATGFTSTVVAMLTADKTTLQSIAGNSKSQKKKMNGFE